MVTGSPRDVRTSIVEAAAQLLREDGASALTTRGVAQAAGVQAPTIYRLFGDKDGLVDAVAEYVMTTYVAAKAADAADDQAGADPVAALRAGWRTHVDFGLANPELYALLNAPGRRAHSPATAAGIEVLRTRVRRLAAAGLLRVGEERAVAMIHAAGSGAVLALLQSMPDERDRGLADDLFQAVLARILAAPEAHPTTSPATAAITLRAVLPELPALTGAEAALMGEWLTRSLGHLES